MPSRKVMIHSSKKRCTACIAICKRPSSWFAKRWRQTSLLVLSWRFPDFIEQKQWSWWLIISHSWLPRKYWRIVAILQNTMSFDQKFCTNNAIFGSMRIRRINFSAVQQNFLFQSFPPFSDRSAGCRLTISQDFNLRPKTLCNHFSAEANLRRRSWRQGEALRLIGPSGAISWFMVGRL